MQMPAERPRIRRQRVLIADLGSALAPLGARERHPLHAGREPVKRLFEVGDCSGEALDCLRASGASMKGAGGALERTRARWYGIARVGRGSALEHDGIV